MTRTLLLRCAPLAIAASVALPAVSANAQVASAPAIVLPPADAAPAPAIVLPEPEPIAAAPVEPMEAPAAQVASSLSEPDRPRPARETAARASQRVTPPAASAVEAMASPAITAPAIPTTPPVEAAPVPPAEQQTTTTADNSTNEALIAGLLGALGIAAVGGVALLAARGRRRDNSDRDTSDYGAVEQNGGPVAAPAPQPAFSAPVASATSFAAPPMPATASISPAASGWTSHPGGDPVALPNQVPATFHERDALLKELVAAKPDRANPFTSVRARARRAKLIMQSLGEDFRSRKPRIDLSEYTNRWPALRGWQPATA